MSYKANKHYTDKQSYGSYTRHFLSSFNVRSILIQVISIWSCAPDHLYILYTQTEEGSCYIDLRLRCFWWGQGCGGALPEKTDTKLFVIEFIEQNSSKTY